MAFLNGRLLTRGTTLYVGSTSADVFDPSATELVIEGREYYELRGWTDDGNIKPETLSRLGLG